MKRPYLADQPLPCPFCGRAPRVIWNGGMTIKCVTTKCCQPKTSWWRDADKCVEQWNQRAHAENYSPAAEVARHGRE